MRASADMLLPRKIEAAQKMARRLQGKLFLSRFRSTSVQLLGGCNAALDSCQGVTNPDGQLFTGRQSHTVHQGLYVCDASIIPCSLGVNPIGTIATVSERVAAGIVADAAKFFQAKNLERGLPTSVPDGALTKAAPVRSSCDVIIHEQVEGEIGGMPCTIKLIMHMGRRKLDHQRTDILRGSVGGHVVIPTLQADPLYIAEGTVDMCVVDSRSPFTQFMHYHLLLTSSKSGQRMYQESTTLHAQMYQLPAVRKHVLRGTFHVTPLNLLKSVLTLQGRRKTEFICRLMGSILQTYIVRTPRLVVKEEPKVRERSYPAHVLHEIITGDGTRISCKQWPSQGSNGGLVLLLNGYSTESFCLPTEPQDLVRVLLENGYEPWLLQMRLHPSHPTKLPFDFDSIAKYDIPAGMRGWVSFFATECEGNSFCENEGDSKRR